jgi:hypothetical protein
MPEIIRPHETQGASRVLIRAGWKDVPHLSKEAQQELEADIPDWLVEARTMGIPSIGSGAIYAIPEARIKVDPFSIPSHWPRAYAMDVGWNWTAALWCAWDRESLTKYIFGEYYGQKELPQIHADAIKTRGDWIEGVIDPSANNSSQRDGERLMAEYDGLGLKLTKANNAVEAGLVRTWRDLSIGRTKVFSTLQRFFEEYRNYHRDENGKIVKKKDHLMDCMRYLHNSGEDVMKVKPARAGISSTVDTPVGPGGY